ncbi:hypothetical protein DF16_pBMB400orf00209 (plasmid) [Bacillus thuringiensis serovar kurstaki str. YBT-1520]|nr:hypothetical protein DF16_pBMB400orf00209 [Bacillus thuringiensis serovar kurstaki str. YBT-1520]KEH45987.1 hypothetical protein BG09_5318 [Bacillus thuringiensis serovar kurstaki str. HD-1]KLA18387.1 hypothetical protein B4158_0865 [Bacillus cereus]
MHLHEAESIQNEDTPSGKVGEEFDLKNGYIKGFTINYF